MVWCQIQSEADQTKHKILVFSPLYALDSGIGSDFAMDEDDEDTY